MNVNLELINANRKLMISFKSPLPAADVKILHPRGYTSDDSSFRVSSFAPFWKEITIKWVPSLLIILYFISTFFFVYLSSK
jgi:hypothetical protein